LLHEEIKRKQPFDIPEEEAYLNVRRTESLLALGFERLFKSHGISEPKYNVLRILRGAGGDGLPCLEIGGRMITRVPDVTRLVDRLEAQALVRRARTSRDRRVVLVSLTARGLKLLATLDEPVLQIHDEQLGHMTHDELRELSRLLTKARNRPGVD
jgi:DNA-binding MarR family transcriptional regulator